MRNVLLFSMLLLGGLVLSQVLPGVLGEANEAAATAIRLLTMVCLSFIMIHVGYEFDIERGRLASYAVDYGVAATAAAFPWIFCALYFIIVMSPPDAWSSFDAWRDALLASRFAAPTSAGILFSMLAAAGLSATWLFRKARVLAIFDDLDTVLLMIPLKMMIVGARWQLAVIVLVMALLLWIGWRWLHRMRLPVTWPWVLSYATVITVVSELIYRSSKLIDDIVPIHIEVLLPAFVLGCATEEKELCVVPENRAEPQQPAEGAGPFQKATAIVTALAHVSGLSGAGVG